MAKTGKVPSLLELCQKTCVRYLDQLSELGDVPLRLVFDSVLTFATAEQLKIIDDANPRISKDLAPLWKVHCLRTFSNLREKYANDEKPRDWRRIYDKAVIDKQEELKQAREKLKKSYSKLEKAKESRKIVVADPIPIKKSKSSSNAILKKKPELLRKSLVEAKVATNQRTKLFAGPKLTNTDHLFAPQPVKRSSSTKYDAT